ncbi:MAG: hypothetical protein IJW42_02595 [Alistipes sp.]|nr:hypothetical protein [Alistipes sp.]
MGIIGNMGAQSEIAYGEDGLNKLDELDEEFFTYPKLHKLPNFPILNYQLSIINCQFPIPPRPKKTLQNQRPNRQIYHL